MIIFNFFLYSLYTFSPLPSLPNRVNRTKIDSEGNSVLHAGAAGGVSGVCWAITYPGAENLLTTPNAAGLTPAQVAHASLSV